jgi:hypothetical protein
VKCDFCEDILGFEITATLLIEKVFRWREGGGVASKNPEVCCMIIRHFVLFLILKLFFCPLRYRENRNPL